MFLFADSFFTSLTLFRLCWIRGRFGGGKTFLAVAIANELIKRGICDGAIANIPTRLKLPNWRKNLIRRTAIVFDEAWLYLDNRTSLTNDRSYGAFARKFETIWLLPSVIPLDKRVSFLAVERIFRINIPVVGAIFKHINRIPFLGRILREITWLFEEFWVYRWQVSLGYVQESGWFVLSDLYRYRDMYLHKYVPSDDGDISELWKMSIEALMKEQGSYGSSEWYREVDASEGETETESNGIQVNAGDKSKVLSVAGELRVNQGTDEFY